MISLKNESNWFKSKIKIKEVMTRMPYTVSHDARSSDAKKIMTDYRVRHLPVLRRGELIGVLSEQDLSVADSFCGPGYLTAADIMTSVPYVADPNTPLCDVLSEMISRKIGSVVVKSPREIPIGIFTSHDALQLLRAVILLGSRERDDLAFHDTQVRSSKAA